MIIYRIRSTAASRETRAVGASAFRGAFTGVFSYHNRMQAGTETNPEEFLGSALATSFTIALAEQLEWSQHPPTTLHTTAIMQLTAGRDSYTIASIELGVEALVPGVDEESFHIWSCVPSKTAL